MLILIAGMIRSGSTLHFNMARLLLQKAQISHETDYIASYADIESRYAEFMEAHEKDASAPKALIVKTHHADWRLKPLLRQDGVHAFYIYRNTFDMAASLSRKTGRPIGDSWPQVTGALRAKHQLLDHPDVIVSRYEDVTASYEIELMKMAAAIGVDVTPRDLSTLKEKLEPAAQRQHLENVTFEKTPVAKGSTWSMRQEGEGDEDYVLVDPSTFLHRNHFTSDGGVGSWADTLTASEVAELAMLEEDIARKVTRTRIGDMGSEINRLTDLEADNARKADERAARIVELTSELSRLQGVISDNEQTISKQNDAARKQDALLREAEEMLAATIARLGEAERALETAEGNLRAALEDNDRTVKALQQAEHTAGSERTRAAEAEEALKSLRAAHQQAERDKVEQSTRIQALLEAGKRKDRALQAVPILKAQLTQARAVASREREALRNQVCSMHAWRELLRANPARKTVRSLPVPKVPQSLEWPVTNLPTEQANGVKISIVTPSYNSAADLERAIQSVLDQDYPNWEHIVVDGGSTDNTREILQKYDHLRWISEPDRGQVDAINKGFAMAQGDVVSYLNADDYYKNGAFAAVADCFRDDDVMVVYGDVEVYHAAADKWWLNRPCFDFRSVLRHWEPNAFCVNPVGYFFRREVQQAVPILESDGAKHDLAFLMGVAWRYEKQSRKLNQPLGVFINAQDTQTGREQSVESYWSAENFAFIDRFLEKLSSAEQKAFRHAQEKGYAQRRKWLRESQRKQSEQAAHA